MKRLLLCLGFLSLLSVGGFAHAPMDSIGVVKNEDGKSYVRYLIEPSETIYGISTKFGIPIFVTKILVRFH